MTDGKSRHGCLTAFLILMIIANSATALMYLFGSGAIRQSIPNMPGFAFPMLIVMALFNLVCAIAIFKWKKWGFWGFCASSIVALTINLYIGLGIGPSLAPLSAVSSACSCSLGCSISVKTTKAGLSLTDFDMCAAVRKIVDMSSIMVTKRK